MSFIILDETNTARCTFNNPLTGHSQSVITLDEPRSIFIARVQFAYSQGIHHSMVEQSVIHPTKRLEAA